MKHVVALSGGADSTAMSLRLKELHPEIEYEFVYTPTGDELPPMEAHWKNLSNIIGPIKKLSTLTLFDVIEKKKAIPNFRMRFCTEVIKIKPFLKYMETLPKGSIMYVGLRGDEEARTGLYTDEEDTFSVSYPMREWKWTRKDVENYLSCRGISIPERTDCGACFYQRLEEWKELNDKYPDRYDKYIELEEKYGHTFRSPKRDTWAVSLKDLREEFKKRSLRKNKKKDRDLMCSWCAR